MDLGPALLCTQGTLVGERFPITVEGLRIGREPGNEIQIEDGGVSRQHARVLLHNGAVWVQDAGSRNGIFVNGERIPDHKQLKVGDKLTVGSHVFEVSPPTAANVAPRAAPPAALPTRPAAKAAPRWKIWPFVVAVLLVLGFVACIGVIGKLHDPVADAARPSQGPAYSLNTMLEAQPTAPAADAAPGGPPSVEQALAVVAGADQAAARASLPDAPPGTTSRELVDMAQGMYDGGRLADARTHYQMALKLDPGCEICKVRIERIEAELATQVQQRFDAGMRAFDSMQFAEAASSWETVLMLVPDPADPMHVRAAEYLQKAKDASAAHP